MSTIRRDNSVIEHDASPAPSASGRPLIPYHCRLVPHAIKWPDKTTGEAHIANHSELFEILCGKGKAVLHAGAFSPPLRPSASRSTHQILLNQQVKFHRGCGLPQPATRLLGAQSPQGFHRVSPVTPPPNRLPRARTLSVHGVAVPSGWLRCERVHSQHQQLIPYWCYPLPEPDQPDHSTINA